MTEPVAPLPEPAELRRLRELHTRMSHEARITYPDLWWFRRLSRARHVATSRVPLVLEDFASDMLDERDRVATCVDLANMAVEEYRTALDQIMDDVHTIRDYAPEATAGGADAATLVADAVARIRRALYGDAS